MLLNHLHFTLLAQEPAQRLPPTTRASVIMALVAIALLGMFFVVAILLGGHWVRRLGDHRRGPSVPPDREPLTPIEPLPGPTSDVSTDDTVHDMPGGETMANP